MNVNVLRIIKIRVFKISISLHFILFALAPKANAALNADACTARGGEMNGMSCLCVLENEYITEKTQTCFLKAIERLNQMQANKKFYCPPSKRNKAVALDRQALCQNPAQVICDPSTNSEMIDYQLYETKYYQTRFQIAESQSDRLRQVTGKSYCWELEGSEAQRCLDAQEQELNAAFWNTERFALAKQRFIQSKKRTIDYLNRKIKMLMSESQTPEVQTHIVSINKAIQRVSGAELYFNSLAEVASSAGTGPIHYCIVHGAIYVPVTSTESLEFIFVHELAHLIDGSVDSEKVSPDVVFQYDRDADPFRRVLDCEVKNGLVQSADLACIRHAAESEPKPDIAQIALVD